MSSDQWVDESKHIILEVFTSSNVSLGLLATAKARRSFTTAHLLDVEQNLRAIYAKGLKRDACG